MRRGTFLGLLLVTAVGSAACASSGESGGVRRDARVLLPDELTASGLTNAYEAVERLRPRWLEMRDVRSLGTGPGQIVVYLNNVYLGGPEALRQFQVHQVVRIRYLDAAQATATLTGYDATRHVVAGIVVETGSRQ